MTENGPENSDFTPSLGTPGEGRGEGLGLNRRKIRDAEQRILQFAKEMWKQSTDAERKLWSILRGRSLARFKFRRQHPIAGYIADFYCARCQLVVELDGGQHSDPKAMEYDQRRTEQFARLDIRVLRFNDRDMLRDPIVVAGEILRHIEDGRPSPQPSPGVPGEGERGE